MCRALTVVAAGLLVLSCGRAAEPPVPEGGKVPITPPSLTDSGLPSASEVGETTDALGGDSGPEVHPTTNPGLPDGGGGCPAVPPVAGTTCSQSTPCNWPDACGGYVTGRCESSAWYKLYLPSSCPEAEFAGCWPGAPCMAFTGCVLITNGCVVTYTCNQAGWFEYQNEVCGPLN